LKTFAFHPEALAELQEQALYYQERNEGLGDRFTTQIEAAISLAVSMPGIGSPYKYRTRRVFPKDFGYSVVYREHGEVLWIVAVAAFRRKPGYWRHRQ
jgi:plasmid stabilization system protein ParE